MRNIYPLAEQRTGVLVIPDVAKTRMSPKGESAAYKEWGAMMHANTILGRLQNGIPDFFETIRKAGISLSLGKIGRLFWLMLIVIMLAIIFFKPILHL